MRMGTVPASSNQGKAMLRLSGPQLDIAAAQRTLRTKPNQSSPLGIVLTMHFQLARVFGNTYYPGRRFHYAIIKQPDERLIHLLPNDPKHAANESKCQQLLQLDGGRAIHHGQQENQGNGGAEQSSAENDAE